MYDIILTSLFDITHALVMSGTILGAHTVAGIPMNPVNFGRPVLVFNSLQKIFVTDQKHVVLCVVSK